LPPNEKTILIPFDSNIVLFMVLFFVKRSSLIATALQR